MPETRPADSWRHKFDLREGDLSRVVLLSLPEIRREHDEAGRTASRSAPENATSECPRRSGSEIAIEPIYHFIGCAEGSLSRIAISSLIIVHEVLKMRIYLPIIEMS